MSATAADIDVPTGSELFEALVNEAGGYEEFSGEELLKIRNAAEDAATRLEDVAQKVSEHEERIENFEEKVGVAEERLSRVEERQGIEGNADPSANVDDEDLPSPGTTLEANDKAAGLPSSGATNADGTAGDVDPADLPSPGDSDPFEANSSADAGTAANVDEDCLPSPGTSRGAGEGTTRTRKKATLANDATPRTVHVVDREDVGPLEDLETIRPRSEGHPSAPTFKQVEIADSAEDADDRVILYDPSAPGAGKDLVESTDVLPTNPEALER